MANNVSVIGAVHLHTVAV